MPIDLASFRWLRVFFIVAPISIILLLLVIIISIHSSNYCSKSGEQNNSSANQDRVSIENVIGTDNHKLKEPTHAKQLSLSKNINNLLDKQEVYGSLKGLISKTSGEICKRFWISIRLDGSLSENGTVTNDDGEYVFNKIPIGLYQVFLGSPTDDRRSPDAMVDIIEGKISRLDLIVEDKPILRGVASDFSGKPICWALLSLTPQKSNALFPHCVITDSSGEFCFNELPPGRYGWSLKELSGKLIGIGQFTVGTNIKQTINIVPPNFILHSRVLFNKSLNPVVGATIQLYFPEFTGWIAGSADTEDNTGAFTLAGIPDGDLLFSIMVDGLVYQRHLIRNISEMKQNDILIEEPAVVQITIINKSNSEMIKDATIWLMEDRYKNERLQQGIKPIDKPRRIPPGLYWIKTEAIGYNDVQLNKIRFSVGSNSPLNIHVEPNKE